MPTHAFLLLFAIFAGEPGQAPPIPVMQKSYATEQLCQEAKMAFLLNLKGVEFIAPVVTMGLACVEDRASPETREVQEGPAV